MPWLLRKDQELREIPFSQVIFAATRKRLLAIISEVLRRMNAPDSAVQNLARINEASSHFEDLIRELLNRVPGFTCDFARTAEDRVQRSGYPDLAPG